MAFGGTDALSFTIIDDNTISATVDSGATGAVTITSPGGTATSSDIFTLILPPTVIWFTPSSGGTGTVVTISGIAFTGVNAVSFDDTPAASFTVVNDSTIMATVGRGGTGDIIVSSPAGLSAPVDTFNFYPAPTITSFTPDIGIAGAVITITGANFTGVTTVQCGGIPVASFTVTNSTTMSAMVGSGATGLISVTAVGGTATSSDAFTFIDNPAQLTGITLTADPPDPILTGTTIILNATVEGSGIAADNVQYQFVAQYRLSDGSWAPNILLQVLEYQ